jgi:hypothetical protein
MAIYGEYGSPIKATLGDLTAAAITNAADTQVDIAQALAIDPKAGPRYIVCIITTTADTRVEIGGVSTATSFLITAADTFICSLASDRDIGLWGVTGTPTVTIKRVVV